MASVKDNELTLASLWLKGQTIYKRSAKAVGLTDNFITVIYTIYRHGEDCSQKYLVAKTLLPKQTIHFVIGKLEGQRIVVTGHSKKDRRVKVVSLTAKGLGYAQKIIAPFVKDSRDALASMSSEEQTTLLHLLGRYIDALQEAVNKNVLKGEPFKH